MTKPKQDQQAIRERVTKLMLDALSNDTPPWRQPWNGGNAGLVRLTAPCNFRSRRHYHGINPLLLLFSSMLRGYSSPYWGTPESWEKQLGARPMEDEVPTYVIFYTLVPIVENNKPKLNPKGEPIRFPLMREYPLYNADQLVGDTRLNKYLVMPDEINTEPDYAPAEDLIKAIGANMRHAGIRASYNFGTDQITVPAKAIFETMADYYETVFHEHAHWTEHPKRLGIKGERNHAFYELVSEISACMLLLEIRVPMAEQMLEASKSYVKSWVEQMGSDPKYIFDAASRAGKVVDYLLSFKAKKKKKAA